MNDSWFCYQGCPSILTMLLKWVYLDCIPLGIVVFVV